MGSGSRRVTRGQHRSYIDTYWLQESGRRFTGSDQETTVVRIECASDVGRRWSGGELSSGGVVDFHFRTSTFSWRRLGTVRCSALRQVMRSWGVESELELSTWLGNHGFPATRPGNHINGRAQEYILSAWCREDARVALLECVLVALTLEEGRHRPRDVPPSGGKSPGVRMRRTGVPMEVPSGSWAQMDRVDLEEEFLRRAPMLKSCPHFLRARFRHCASLSHFRKDAEPSWLGIPSVKSELGKHSVWCQ